jgi:hypothetical protein
MEFENHLDFRDVQLKKLSFPILATVFGIMIVSKDVQFLKHERPIEISLSDNVISLSW